MLSIHVLKIKSFSQLLTWDLPYHSHTSHHSLDLSSKVLRHTYMFFTDLYSYEVQFKVEKIRPCSHDNLYTMTFLLVDAPSFYNAKCRHRAGFCIRGLSYIVRTVLTPLLLSDHIKGMSISQMFVWQDIYFGWNIRYAWCRCLKLVTSSYATCDQEVMNVTDWPY